MKTLGRRLLQFWRDDIANKILVVYLIAQGVAGLVFVSAIIAIGILK